MFDQLAPRETDDPPDAAEAIRGIETLLARQDLEANGRALANPLALASSFMAR